jgi:mRNA-degrading endonuclease toxin of MazEF toxin-antitoxin module
VIFQNDERATGESTIVVPLTSQDNPGAYYRVAVHPSPENGLDRPCWLEIDKLGAIRTAWLGRRIGALHHDTQTAALTLSRSLVAPTSAG